ncbi:TonB-dependent receptor [Phenylobacterium sp. LjRoot219]|uniref:TonB-dependent receptor n=1 Tax=Phenylobacterium sp. LjRoot219 TaxID=3342283 RepID=UPI003ECE5992
MGLKHYLLSASILTGLGLATPSLAQEDQAVMEELVVTGTRRAVNLQDVSINMTAVSADAIEAQRLDNMRELAAFTPGVTMQDTGPRGTGTMIVRGLSANNTSVTGENTSKSVATYLGEVPLYLDFKLLDIDRVEILLGPQGTLYGQGTMAGAVRYLPRRPDTDDFSVDVHARGYSLSKSSNLGWSGDFALNVPIVKDHIAWRSVVGYFDDPGFMDYPYLLRTPGVSDPEPDFSDPAAVNANLRKRKDLNDEETFTTRQSLLVRANDDFEVNFNYLFQDTQTHGRQANGVGVLGSGKYEAPWRFEEPSRRTATLYSMEVKAGLFDVAELVSATAYSKQKVRTTGDQTDLLLDLDYGYQLFPNFNAYTLGGNDYKQFNQELRLVSTHGGPLNWAVGGFYNEFKTDTFSFEIAPGLPEYLGVFRPDNIEYASFTKSKTEEKAVFGEATYQVTDAWQLTAGARYFEYTATITGGTATPLIRTVYPAINYRVRSGDTSDNGMVYKFNTSYKFSDDLMVYATVSNGYRIGGVNRVAPCPVPLPAGQNVCALPNELFFTPDKTLNKELGLRARFFDRRVAVNGSIYHIDWDDVQVSSRTVNGAVGITGNAAKAKSQGLEMSFNARVTDGVTLSGNYSYNDAKLTSGAPDVVDGTDDVFSGDRLPGTPKHSGAFTVAYNRPLDNGMNLTANYSAIYTGEIYSKIGLRGDGEVLPDYWVSKASIGVARDNWEATLFADNLFNEYAVVAVSNDFGSVGQIDGVTKRYYAHGVLRPRTVGVDLRYHY